MKKALKWLLAIVGGLVGVVVLVAVVGYIASERRIDKTYEIAVDPLIIPTDEASIEEGRRLTVIRGCNDCHGSDFGGKILIDDPALGTIFTANLTAGEGSATKEFVTEDWVRAIRHGIGSDGRGLKIMPSNEYAGLSDEQVSQIVAYLSTVPSVDRVSPEMVLGPLGRALFMAGQLPLLPAEVIDHSIDAPPRVEPVASAEYGAYLAITCTGCHKPNLAGGALPGAGPDAPMAPNLTPAGNLSTWTYEEFATTMRTGITPDGRLLDPSQMPWSMTLEMTDTEIEAIWLYLSSLSPALPDA